MGLVTFVVTSPTDSNKSIERAMMCIYCSLAVGVMGGLAFATWWVFGE
jgi:hypothetical protein